MFYEPKLFFGPPFRREYVIIALLAFRAFDGRYDVCMYGPTIIAILICLSRLSIDNGQIDFSDLLCIIPHCPARRRCLGN